MTLLNPTRPCLSAKPSKDAVSRLAMRAAFSCHPAKYLPCRYSKENHVLLLRKDNHIKTAGYAATGLRLRRWQVCSRALVIPSAPLAHALATARFSTLGDFREERRTAIFADESHARMLQVSLEAALRCSSRATRCAPTALRGMAGYTLSAGAARSVVEEMEAYRFRTRGSRAGAGGRPRGAPREAILTWPVVGATRGSPWAAKAR